MHSLDIPQRRPGDNPPIDMLPDKGVLPETFDLRADEGLQLAK